MGPPPPEEHLQIAATGPVVPQNASRHTAVRVGAQVMVQPSTVRLVP